MLPQMYICVCGIGRVNSLSYESRQTMCAHQMQMGQVCVYYHDCLCHLIMMYTYVLTLVRPEGPGGLLNLYVTVGIGTGT